MQAGGMQGNLNLGRPGNLNQVPATFGNPNKIIPEPLPLHPGKPTRTGTTVGSEEPLDVVIQVFDTHSGCPAMVEGASLSGESVMVEAGIDRVQ
jgi:hypothetical protein